MKKQATNALTVIIQPQRIGVGFRTLGLILVLILLAPGNVLAQDGTAPGQGQPERAGRAQPAAPAAPAAVTSWTNAAGGNWNVAGNWDNGVPGAGDNAIINLAGTYTVIMNVDVTVNSLTLGGASGTQTLDGNNRTLTLNSTSTVNANGVLDLNSGDLTGNGDLTVNGTLDWTGGSSTISGAGALTVNGSITINAWPNPAVTLDGRTLTLSNTGTGAWTGEGMTFKNGAVFDNQGAFDIQDTTSIGDIGGTNRFDNSGTVTKSAGSGTSRIDVAFNNTGTVNVNSGTLDLNGGGTHASTFNVAAGKTLQFSGGTHSLGDGTAFTGDGTAQITGNGTVVNTDGATTGTTVSASTTLSLTGSGKLGGDGKLTVNGTFDWTGGSSTISGAGALTVNGSITINAWPNPAVTLDGRTLTLSNTGTGAWTGEGMTFKNGAVFDNQGAFDIQDTTSIGDIGGTNRFDNAGTVTKSAGSGTSRIDVAFNNTGTVNVNSGILGLNGGGTHGSTFNVAAGKILQFAGGTHSLDGVTFGGAGTAEITGGTVNLANTVSFAGNLTRSGGTFNAGASTVTFNGGATQNLTLNTATAFNNLTVSSGTTLVETVATDNGTVNGTLTNNGTIRKSKSGLGTGSTGFGLTGATINVSDLGSMTSLQVDRLGSAHAQENANGGGADMLDLYFSLTPDADPNNAELCLSYTDADLTAAPAVSDEANLRLCRWTGSAWSCPGRSGSSNATNNTVCAAGVSAFSDWTMGEVGPTAVTLQSLTARGGAPAGLLAIALGGLAVLGLVGVWRWRKTTANSYQ
ncbi:MAG: beta strand repeat-containing protein [Anaerolineae bacterium]